MPLLLAYIKEMAALPDSSGLLPVGCQHSNDEQELAGEVTS